MNKELFTIAILCGIIAGGIILFTLFVLQPAHNGPPLCMDTKTNVTVPCPVNMGGFPSIPNTTFNWSVP